MVLIAFPSTIKQEKNGLKAWGGTLMHEQHYVKIEYCILYINVPVFVYPCHCLLFSKSKIAQNIPLLRVAHFLVHSVMGLDIAWLQIGCMPRLPQPPDFTFPEAPLKPTESLNESNSRLYEKVGSGTCTFVLCIWPIPLQWLSLPQPAACLRLLLRLAKGHWWVWLYRGGKTLNYFSFWNNITGLMILASLSMHTYREIQQHSQ